MKPGTGGPGNAVRIMVDIATGGDAVNVAYIHSSHLVEKTSSELLRIESDSPLRVLLDGFGSMSGR